MQLNSDTSEKANALLDDIESKLQADMNNDSLSPAPMMLSLKLLTRASANGDVPSFDGQVNIVPAADYFSVYSQQDFC